MLVAGLAEGTNSGEALSRQMSQNINLKNLNEHLKPTNVPD